MSLEQTQRRRQAVETIHDIVNAMRAIAAGRIQGAQRVLESSRRYQAIVERALAAVTGQSGSLPLPHANGRPALLLVLTSEQPLCGTFNQEVLALAERRWQELRQAGHVHLIVAGNRGVRLLAARGLAPDGVEPAATSVHGLHDMVKRLAARVDQRYAAGQLGALHVIYSRYQSISEQVPAEERVLPLDLARIRQDTAAPARSFHRYLTPAVLLAGLISEYAFISLYRIAAESFASEQASRLIAMDGATRNTEQMVKELLDLERRERQGEVIRQVLELIAARFVAD